MFYVSRKVGKKYGVIDTNDGVEEFYSMKSLAQIVRQGINIKGVTFCRGKLVVTPFSYVKDKVTAAKKKLIEGYATGYPGFDLKIEGDKVIALPLTETFFEFVMNTAKDKNFILNIPDIVTHIGDNFFNSPNTLHLYSYNIFIVLPKSLKEIGSNALAHYLIHGIDFNNCILDRVKGEFALNGGSLGLYSSNFKDSVLNVKHLEVCSLSVGSIPLLSLPYIESIDESAIVSRVNKHNFSVTFGNRLTKLTNFVQPLMYDASGKYGSMSKHLMSTATLVFLNEDCVLTDIDMRISRESSFSPYSFVSYTSSYIFVLHERLLPRIENLLRRHSLKSSVRICIGLLTYENNEGLAYLRDNLAGACQTPRKYFKDYFKNEDFGCIKRLHLK